MRKNSRYCVALFFIVLSLLSRGIVQAQSPQQPPQIAGVPNITWGMTPDQVRQIAPGRLDGLMLIYRSEFVTYPVVVQYYFNQQQQLNHVIFQPGYAYDDPAQYTPKYQQILRYLKDLYGQPAKTQEQMILWTPQNVPTQATLMLFPRGWMTRFDSR